MESVKRDFPLQPQSRLLQMSAEIRNLIYELVLVTPPSRPARGSPFWNLVAIRSNRSLQDNLGAFGVAGPPHRSLDLLLVCCQIHSEAETTFYTLNHLCYTPSAGTRTAAQHSVEKQMPKSRSLGPSRPPSAEPWLVFPSPIDAQSREETPFLSSLGSNRLKAIQALTIKAHSCCPTLPELPNELHLATNLKILHIHTRLDAWLSEEHAIAWARHAQTKLRTTSVKEVKIAHPNCRPKLHLPCAGSPNYGIFQKRAKKERSWELSRKIEDMLKSVVED